MEPSEYTCGKCGKEMRFNVPRLGTDGGFVHADTGKFDCEFKRLMDYDCPHCFDTGYLDVMGGPATPCPFCGERIRDL